MSELLRQVWQAVRPVNAQQRFLWWCGTLMLASGVVHGVVALVDWAPWYGAVSWRKPTVFGMSFGILAWSAVWIMRQLPVRRWGWVPVGLLGAGSVAEIAMITTQRWRGVPSHFNQETGFDDAIWSAMGNIVVLVALALAVLLVWSLVRFAGTTAARIAVVVGLLAIEVSGYIGFGMAAEGEAYVDATGRVPETVVFGAEGSAKVAHAIGMHGLQVLGLLAIALGLGVQAKHGTQIKLMATAVAGYAAVFGAVAATAYAGRAWTSPAAPMAALGLAGVVALVAVAGFVAARVLRGRGRARAGVVS
jgi:hypothetical protein